MSRWTGFVIFILIIAAVFLWQCVATWNEPIGKGEVRFYVVFMFAAVSLLSQIKKPLEKWLDSK